MDTVNSLLMDMRLDYNQVGLVGTAALGCRVRPDTVWQLLVGMMVSRMAQTGTATLLAVLFVCI